MATTNIRSDETDSYTVLSTYNGYTNSEMEQAIAQSLVQSNFNSGLFSSPSGTHQDPVTGLSWEYAGLNTSYVNTSAISNNPAGTVTEYSVISTELYATDVSVNSYSTNISSASCANNTYTFESLNTSAPYYDSNYVITQSLVPDCFDNQEGTFVQGTFDLTNANAKIQHAMQSRWNTTTNFNNSLDSVGPDPAAITQDTNFNTQQAFAQKGSSVNSTTLEVSDTSYESYWFSVGSDGSLVSHLVDASYQPISNSNNSNNLLVLNRDMTEQSLNHVNDIGIFRIQKMDNIVLPQVNLDGDGFVDINTDETYFLQNMPMFNGNGQDPSGELVYNSSKNSLPIPGSMTVSEFSTLFNEDVYNTIMDGWTFDINVNTDPDSGYHIVDDPHPLVSNLDNSDLLDNPYYMENYVSNSHAINISNSTPLQIDASLNGQSSVISEITIDLTNGETLSSSHAGVNGQIILNTNSATTRHDSPTSNDVASNIIPYVYYEEDNNANHISGDQTTEPYFEALWQKVAEESATTSSSNYFQKSNDALMTLYGTQILSGVYEQTDFSFNFNNSLFGSSTDIRLWKINATNNVIVNPQSFYSDAAYTQLVSGIATSGTITALNVDLQSTYNEYRIYLTAKPLTDLGLYSALGSSGWSLNYTSGTWLETSSTQAFSESGLPIYDPAFIQHVESGNNVSFLYTYGTEQNSVAHGGLIDYVDVTYNYNGANIVRIPQPEITRTYSNTSSVNYVSIADASYSFTGSIYNKSSWELVFVTAESSYSAVFNPNYGPFSNLEMTINNIDQENTYYAIRYTQDPTNDKLFAPQSALQYVVAPQISNLTDTVETISRANGLSISGTFSSADLKPFKSYAQGGNSNTNSWTNITTETETDIYYGVNTQYTIDTPGSLVQGQLVSTNEYTPFTNSVNSSIILNLTSEHYYIPFNIDASNTNILTSFETTVSTISADTNLSRVSMEGDLDYLTLTNGYSNATNWVTTNYNLSIDVEGSTSTFTVKDSLDNTVFTIESFNNSIFLGDFIVTHIPIDYYRTNRLLGSNLSPVFSEEFIITDYPTAPNGYNHIMLGSSGQILEGLSVGTNNSVHLSSSNTVLGGWQRFRVKGDYMSINEVGTTSSPVSSNELGISGYNSGSLSFTYESGANHSATFNFGLYRGYYSYNSSTNQYYTITRGDTSATFEVDGGSLSDITQTLTSNMYYNQSFTVNDLRNGSNQLVANLGVTGYFLYSIPPTGSLLSYSVSVTGDNVSVSLVNPATSATSSVTVDPDATPVSNPQEYGPVNMTLKDYGKNNMYTFSGLWHSNSRLMAIRPSRVKMSNSNFTHDSLVYRINVSDQPTKLYKAKTTSLSSFDYNWIGNPTLHDSQDPNVAPSTSLWSLVSSLNSSDMISTGFTIGRKIIRQDPSLATTTKLAYIISAPPYYNFEQISTASCATIPYDYNSQFVANRTNRYMPCINSVDATLVDEFNPFAISNTYTDINNNTTSVDSSGEILNDITFNLLNTPSSLTDAVMNPNSTRYGLVVPGTKLTVHFYSGLYSSNLNYGNYSNPIWDAPVTSIPSTPDLNGNALIFRGRDVNGAITFSALQYPADIGYSSGGQGYSDILGTSNQYDWYNIDFKIGNSSWFNNNSQVTYFDANAKGIRPTLYTVVDVNDTVTQRNKRRVYKYTTNTTIDIDGSGSMTSDYQAFNLVFNTREYYDFDISVSSSFPSSGLWDYTNQLNSTVIPNASISWVSDTSFNGTNSFVSWAFGNSTTATRMLLDLFSIQNSQKKWVYIHLLPFMRYVNQFNLQVGSIAWDGSVTAPLVSTRVVKLAPSLSAPNLSTSDTYTGQKYSESTL